MLFLQSKLHKEAKYIALNHADSIVSQGEHIVEVSTDAQKYTAHTGNHHKVISRSEYLTSSSR